jgi:hypothetical protein
MEKEKKQIFKILQFNEAYQPPKIKVNNKKGIVEFGKDNLFPQYLLNLYNNEGSPINKSIINKKVKMIAGNGFQDILDPALKEFIKKNKLEKEIKKAALDYEIYNGFALEIIWDREGLNMTSLKHIPFQKVRVGVKSEEEIPYDHYLICSDWSQSKKAEFKPVIVRPFNPMVKQGKQLYFYCEYNPESDYYPIPFYSTTINWVEMDYEVGRFHLNQLKQGYTPSFILNFATGIPTLEEQDDFYKEFKKNYSGTENSGKIIITYSEGQDGKPEFIPVQLNDSDERFIMLKEQITENIVLGHEVPQQLFLATPGKLGSTEERSELLEEFQDTYVTPRQENIEEVINEILGTMGFTEPVKLKEYGTKDSEDNNTNEITQ